MHPLDTADAPCIALLRAVPAFAGTCKDVTERPKIWQEWVERRAYSNDLPMPGPDLDAGDEDDLLAKVGDDVWAGLKEGAVGQCSGRRSGGRGARGVGLPGACPGRP